MSDVNENWVRACHVSEVANDSGVRVDLGDRQIALFNFSTLGSWYAIDNECPHWNEQVLSRGLLGDTGGEPKVACPMHKRCYSLKTGDCLGEAGSVATYPVRIEDGEVYVNTVANRAIATPSPRG